MTEWLGRTLDDRCTRWVAGLLFLLMTVALWIGFSVDTYFASDGANYFVTIIDEARFTAIAPARAHAEYLSQWPLVLAVKCGVTEIEQLEIFFGLGLWFPWAMGFVISLYATRENSGLIFLYLLSVACLNLAAWSVFIGEHLVLLSVAWPIFYFAVIRRPLNLAEQIVTGLLLLAHLRLYESAVATGTIFACLFGIRACFSVDRRERRVSQVFVFLALASIAIAAYWILFPRDADNRSSFLRVMVDSLDHPYPRIGFWFIVFTTVGLLFRFRILALASLVFPLVIVWQSWFDSGISALLAFSTRTLSLSALPLLLGVALLSQLSGFRVTRFQAVSLTIVVTSISLLHVRHLQAWVEFRSRFIAVVQTEVGFVDPDDHEGLVHWGWTNPLLSYLWSDGEVRAIVLSPYPEGYHPFDPRREVVMEKYLRVSPGFVKNDR
ncbi:MAG: hypothetical protein PVJ98_07325 [Akkermansiaceae bacterium]|jgi:hypothetical protein